MKTLLVVFLFTWPVWTNGQDQGAGGLPVTGCGPAHVEFEVKTDKNQHPTGQLEPGKALVYVFGDERRSPHVAYLGGPTVQVGVDGTWMGATRFQSYFFFPVTDGEHRLCVGWQSNIAKVARVRRATNFTAQAGEVYYFRIVSERRQDREMEVWIEPVDGAEGALLISSSGLATSRVKN